jgi:hypothetical protein
MCLDALIKQEMRTSTGGHSEARLVFERCFGQLQVASLKLAFSENVAAQDLMLSHGFSFSY